MSLFDNITTEVNNYEWHIPIANKPHLITLDPLIFKEMVDSGEKKLYKIDLNTRTINGPATIGVKLDHNAEMFIFRVARYHDTMDLADTCCVIQFATIDKYNNTFVGLYPVPFYDIDTLSDYQEILIPWNIPKSVTQSATTIEYNFKFYKVKPDTEDPEKLRLVYNLNTQSATSRVLNTLDVDDVLLHSAYEDVIRAYQEDVSDYSYGAFLGLMRECYDKAELRWENATDILRGQNNP